MNPRLSGWLVVICLVSTTLYAMAEEFTLVTYYPSPRGVYQELRVGGGGPFPDPKGYLHIVQFNADTRPALRVDTDQTGANPVVVDATGAVGIGTASPTTNTKLDVRGCVAVVDGTQGNGRVLTSDANGKTSWQNPVATYAP